MQTPNPPRAPTATLRPPPEHSAPKFAFLSLLAWCVVRLIGMSLRFRLEDATGRIGRDSECQFLFAIWHNRIGIMPTAYRRYLRRTRLATLVSASGDGELLARTLARFGFQPVRGSTSRRGAQSLLEMVSCVEKGYDAVITPDGPRGPAEIVQPGVVNLAKVTGVPITPVSCSVTSCKRAKSWDRFIIPMPFARCVVRVGSSIPVPRDADEATLEKTRVELQDVLNRLGAD
jgi:lysophospholipid acyltransferase (LPLAT)-like uncharacterized protein